MWSVFRGSGDNLNKVLSFPYCNRNSLVAIVGPTGAGKSALSLRIAEHLDGEIVNCDSMQVYRGFDIGTAKLRFEERRGIPHHLLDCVEPTEVFSAGEYARTARAAISGIEERSRVPIVVGGTGFYLRALLEGLPDLPPRNPSLRERLSRATAEHLFKVLQRLDPGAALRLRPRDRMRVTRALEIRMLLGHAAPPLPERRESPGHQVRKIALIPARDELYRRLDLRTEQMFQNGLVEEVRGLLAAGIPDTAKPFEAVGYRQALAVIENKMSLPDAITATQKATRNYAKRQITWFRHDTGVEILPFFGAEVEHVSLAEEGKETKLPLVNI